MTFLVIGSEGFVGRSLCSYLEAKRHRVVKFDIKRGNHEDARYCHLPLAHVDAVYFLAWEVGGSKYLYREEAQLGQIDWNVALMQNVFGQLKESGTPFLFVSSQLAQEVDTVYGVTKRLGEVWTNLLPAGVCVRLWNVYGGFEERNERSHVVADFVHQALDTGEIRMITTGKEQRQFVYIDDVCCAFFTALEHGYHGVYDVTSFTWEKVLSVAQIIGELTGARVIPGDAQGRTSMTANIRPIPGWRAEVSLREGLWRTVNSYCARREGRR